MDFVLASFQNRDERREHDVRLLSIIETIIGPINTDNRGPPTRTYATIGNSGIRELVRARESRSVAPSHDWPRCRQPAGAAGRFVAPPQACAARGERVAVLRRPGEWIHASRPNEAPKYVPRRQAAPGRAVHRVLAHVARRRLSTRLRPSLTLRTGAPHDPPPDNEW